MGWRFRLDSLLAGLNEERERNGLAVLSWTQIAPLLGMSRQSLQNLASNRDMKVTNTRFLEAICRFFGKPIQEVLEPFPPIGREVNHRDVDRLVTLGRELEPHEQPAYHVERLYGPEATQAWEQQRDQGVVSIEGSPNDAD